MKFLLVLVVVGVGLYLLFGRGRKSRTAQEPIRPAPPASPSPMLACAHCGVHLPGDDAVKDAAGRAYCGDAHRLAGPR